MEPAPLVHVAPLWRREPYRVLFPEALVLAWAGVLYWLLHAVGVIGAYQSEYHAHAQIEGFLACIAVGFLFTFIPRRTGAAPARTIDVAVAVAAPAVTTVAAGLGAWIVAEVAWLVLLAIVLSFAVPRLLAPGAGLKLPNAIVWVPAGLLFGAAGAILLAWGDAANALAPRAAGRGLLFQGMFTALIAGIGATLLPVLTRGEAHAETAGTPRDLGAKALHALGALLLAASFVLEVEVSLRAGYAVRAAVVLSALLASARIDRPPTVPGLHRRLVWLSAWLLPIGFALGAVFPDYEEAALHVVFIGGFALMALSVAYHVAIAHGGRPGLLGGRPSAIVAMGALLLGAVALRALVDLDPGRAKFWLGSAAAAFLTATLCWAALVIPRLRSR